MGSKAQNGYKDFDYISAIYGDHLRKWNGIIIDIFREIFLLALEAKMLIFWNLVLPVGRI
jgi:hypothetical protein